VTAPTIQDPVAAIRAGRPVILPTDTVYGLCASAYREAPVLRLYRLKGRDPSRPTALLAASFDEILDAVQELRGRAAVVARALLPGPFTLIAPNPGRRFRWLTGDNPDAIGIRVPALPEPAKAVLARVGVVAATSANLPGGPDPCRVDDVPDELRSKCAAIVDAGELPGVPSTIVDITDREPRILREGAVPAEEALARVRDVAA
jgi:L-threonylcarbamoyladenylate synthase